MTYQSARRFEEVDNPEVRKRMNFDGDETKDYLNSLIESIVTDRAVEHPFLNWYTTNKGTRSYDVLRELILNVYDEVGGDVLHADLS